MCIRDRLLVYVRAEDYGAKPRIGSGIDLDGRRRYTVLDCTDEGGIYALTLEAYRAQ